MVKQIAWSRSTRLSRRLVDQIISLVCDSFVCVCVCVCVLRLVAVRSTGTVSVVVAYRNMLRGSSGSRFGRDGRVSL